MFVQPVIFIQYGNTRCFNGRNTAEQIPETFEMVFHFTSASHDIAAGRIEAAVAGTAGNVHSLQNVDMGAWHLGITNEEAGSSERSKTASYDICVFVIYAFRFLRAGKCLIVTVGIVDAFAVLFVFAAFCIAVISSCSFGFFCFGFFDLLVFLRSLCKHGSCSGSCCECNTKF